MQANNISRLLSMLFSPIFLTAFSMTFLAEWGDRSQIATIGCAHKCPGGEAASCQVYIALLLQASDMMHSDNGVQLAFCSAYLKQVGCIRGSLWRDAWRHPRAHGLHGRSCSWREAPCIAHRRENCRGEIFFRAYVNMKVHIRCFDLRC